ncbi:MAG: hypothetical protein EOM14_05585 [Clostridia bacterium]|nr:hypothetical protein [Clostridia bacterium]
MIYTIFKRKTSIMAWLLAFAFLLSLLAVLLAAPAQAVSSSELNTLKKQQEQLAQQRAQIQSQVDSLNSQVASQTEKLDALTDQLEITNQEIENLTEQIAIYTNSIARLENELNADKQKEQELLAHYKVRMRAMEENGKLAYISILLNATSFTDLLSRINDIRDIMEYDNSLIEDIRAAQLEVAQSKANMEAEMEAQQEVFEDYQNKQADLLQQQQEANAVLASLSSNSAEYQSQLDSVNSLQSALNSQITNMQTQLAEQERLKAEQDAAKDTPSNNSGGGQTNSGSGSGTGQDIVNYAETFLGVSYVYGGTSPSGFDCSGLVYYCYAHFGYYLNRTAAGLAYNGVSVSYSSLQPGDVILFTSTDGSYVGHTGIYIGGGQFIHAPHTGDVVKISNLSDSYYTAHYYGARRIVS